MSGRVLWHLASLVGHVGLVAPRHVGSSQTRDWTSVSCIPRPVLNHWTTREVLWVCLVFFFNCTHQMQICHWKLEIKLNLSLPPSSFLSPEPPLWGKTPLHLGTPPAYRSLCVDIRPCVSREIHSLSSDRFHEDEISPLMKFGCVPSLFF